ncbi:MAG: aminotransferase class I/II-fold pyridoxal phosphate-dependent enzyme [Deltaproteobacteria bacterium]|nr:aminotransferase class I/II-fold pyridoxal phosphate-dependent enzyme [Deltaproteobacteria bacterium]MBW2153863.1 aminotransferase class I/II-fold pyridoxal phosphate-dependent enzyme [Deltaproteobacteria bacterium]
MKTAKRLQDFDAYLGTTMNMILTQMKKEGKDVINLGLGDPDVFPTEEMRKTLADACMHEESHHYPSFYDPMPLKEAIANWYQRRYEVICDPKSEVLPLLGAADGLFHIHTCLLDVGDTALIPDPCYPAYMASTKIAGGVIETVPLTNENGFLPDLDAIDPEVAKRAKMIWINYPNNPTAAHAPEEFYIKLIDWARKFDIAVISDNPYSEICFDGYRAPSFLKFDGAKEIGVELNSMSKAYNCCGWRIGMMLGNADIIAGMNKIKSHSDRGLFYPIQKAATEALNGSDAFMEERNRMFKERRDVVVNALKKMGIDVKMPKATFYVWAAVPEEVTDSKAWCMKVLNEIAVWMIPGSMYGKYGEGYFRIALTHPAERLAEAMDRLERYLA